MDAELTVGFISFRESYVSRVTCKPFESVEVKLRFFFSLPGSNFSRSSQAVASSSTPLFKTLTTTWRFQPASSHSSTNPLVEECSPHAQQSTMAESGSTVVTLDLAFAFANPLYATVSTAFFGQVSELMVKAFAERCLAVYGPGCQ
jgi:coenzyme Q-binding protein COQ10